jgi:hypothetical protein
MHWISYSMIVAIIAAMSITGCGGDDDGGATLPGCGTDNDCKGERVCVNQKCVDPDETGGAADGAAGSGTDGEADGSGTAGESGGTAGGTAGDPGSAGEGEEPEGGTGGSDGVDDAMLEAACIADCDAMTDAGCEETLPSYDQCVASCLLLDGSLQGYCFKETRDYYACKAAGGYTCLDGRAIAHSSCLEEQTARTECTTALPCRKYCETAVEEACAEAHATCVEQCLDERKQLETSCAYDYDRLLACWTDRLICENGLPSPLECEDELAEAAWCIGVHDEDCQGFCWAAGVLGCGSDECVNDCREKIGHDQCGSYYRQALSCVLSLSTLNMACSDGAPVPAGTCADEEASYEECLTNYSG